MLIYFQEYKSVKFKLSLLLSQDETSCNVGYFAM